MLNPMLWTAFEYAVNLLQAIVLVHIPTKYFGYKLGKKKALTLQVLFVLLFFVVVTVLNNYTPWEGFLGFSYIFMIALYSIVCLKGNFFHKVFVVVGEFLLSLVIAQITLTVVAGLADIPFNAILSGASVPRFIAVLVIQILMLYMGTLMIQFRRKMDFKPAEWMRVFLVPVMTFALVLIIVRIVNEHSTSGSHLYAIVAVVVVILINAATFFLINSLERQQVYRETTAQIAAVHEERMRSISDRAADRQELREIQHDLRKPSDRDDVSRTARGRSQCDELYQKMSKRVNKMYTHVEYCANKSLNFLLNEKKAAAVQHGVTLELERTDCPVWLCELDIMIIVGNLLDNAIEAAACSEGKCICFTSQGDDEVCEITVENTTAGPVLKENPKLKSTKGKGHGIGLQSVERTVAHYKGSMDQRGSGNLFTVIVSVFNQEGSRT